MNPTTLSRLKSEGKIKSYSVKKMNAKKISKEKEWIEQELKKWCKLRNLELKKEYRFHPVRKWENDWAVLKGKKVLAVVEYEGLVSSKSRHTTLTGYTGDCEKYNACAKMGIPVLRYTILNHKDVIEDLKELI